MKNLVLLHGWGMSSHVFDGIVERLSVHYAVHALDLPGYNGCAPCEPYTLARLAAYCAANAPARCLVAGWSLGAQVALAWAHAVPEQIEQLILLGATPSFVRREDWPEAVESSVLRAFAAGLRADREGTVKRFVSLQARQDDNAKQVTRWLRACLAERAAPAYSALEQGLQILLETDLRPMLAQIAQPALVIHGERDTLAPLAAGKHLAQALPRARLAMIRGAAHAPFVSEPTRVADLVLELER